MTVTYIHHSGFLVETRKFYYLFDYESGDLPALNPEKPIFVLSSHSHGDHYNPAVFSKAPGARAILSDDIAAPPGIDTLLVAPNREYSLGPGQKLTTFRSTDLGVAFLIEEEDGRIYHAGDLNDWVWEGEPDDWNRDMTAAYRAEMALLAGKTADIAFIPADPRLEDWFYLGVDDFMQQSDARYIFPMHFWGDFSVCEKLKNHPCSEKYRDRIISMKEKGQTFSL